MTLRVPGRPGARPGYVLYIVLVVVVVLTLVAYQISDAMSAEASAAIRAHDLEQAKANSWSGVNWAVGFLTDPTYATSNLDDDQSRFAAQPVGTANTAADENDPRWQGDANLRRGGGRFTLVNLSDTTGGTDGTYSGTRRYGLEDESRKLNINALIAADPVGNVLHDALMKLPNMTEEIADAIVDWVDADDTIRPNGAESDYYSGGQTPYRCKNGPLSSLEELLLVRGVTPELLYGADRNRNGVQDEGETSAVWGGFSRGWSEYLTVYGRELNVDSTGAARINLNNTNLAALDGQLMALDGMTREVADYLIYFATSGTGAPVAATLAQGQVAATPADLRDLVAKAVKDNAKIQRKHTSVFSVLNTQLTLPPRPANGGGGGPGGPQQMVTPVVACPLNDAKTLQAAAQVMMDKLTASEDYELVPRINVNTAPREVLACLKGIEPTINDEDVDKLLANRPAAGSEPTAAWLVTAGGLAPDKFKNIEKYVCGRSGAYRVRSVGYFANPGGPQASCEAVIEVVTEDPDGTGAVARPRIVFFRDTTDLGRVFDDLPR